MQGQTQMTDDDQGEEKIVRAVRTTRELWNAYGEAVTALGTDRAKHLNAYMRRTARAHQAKLAKQPSG